MYALYIYIIYIRIYKCHVFFSFHKSAKAKYSLSRLYNE